MELKPSGSLKIDTFSMRVGAIGDLIAHARPEREGTPILEIGRQFAVNAKENVALVAPVIGDIARRVIDHPNADIAELLGPPCRNAGIALVGCRLDRGPVCRSERNCAHLHDCYRSIVPVRRIFFCRSMTP